MKIETIYIAIPHRADAYIVSSDFAKKPLDDEHDTYFQGDHDLHGVTVLETLSEIQRLANAVPKGHQGVRISYLCDEILDNELWEAK